MFMVWPILLMAIPPVWGTTFSEQGWIYAIAGLTQRGGMALFSGYQKIADSSFGWLVGVDEQGLRFVRDVPGVAVFQWTLPTPQGFEAWALLRWSVWDTLIAYQVDPSGNLSPPETLVFPFPVYGIWWRADPDSLLLFALPDSNPALVWWAGSAPADTLPLPAGVHVHRGTVLPNRSLIVVGWLNAPGDTIPNASDGWIGKIGRNGALLWADTLSTPSRDAFFSVSFLPDQGLICATGMEGGDGVLALYASSGLRIATYRIGAQPDMPFPSMWEWGEACEREQETWVFPGWKSPGGPPDGFPWMGVVRPSGRVDTVSLDEPWIYTTETFPPLRLQPWTYVFTRNIIDHYGNGGVRIVMYRDTARPEIVPLTPDTVMGDTVLLQAAVVDSFSGVDTVEIFYREEDDSLWKTHVCMLQDTCGVQVILSPSTYTLFWYARGVDQAGNARNAPEGGVWTVVRVNVDEQASPAAKPRIRVIPGGLVFQDVREQRVTVLDAAGRVVARFANRDRMTLHLTPGVYAVQMGTQQKVVIVP